MTNVAQALREEISRLARKEIRAQTGKMKQAVVRYRREIASLKRQLQEQERKIKVLAKAGTAPSAAEDLEKVTEKPLRFSARSVRSQRKRLGLSAADYAKLVGVTQLTVYNWEHGKSRPRREQFERLVALRGIGKREAIAQLEEIQAKEEQAAKRKRSRRKK